MRNGRRTDILVVDDLPEKHLVYRASLEELDQNIVSALSGEDALLKLLDRDFAVVLLDVNMPGMSGHETAKLIRQRRRSRYTPIIFVTAYADETQTAEGYSLGAVDFILSPIVPEILRAKVKVFVELEQMRAELADSYAMLEQRVEERTSELADTARRLAEEVTERKRAEERLTILVRELSHRVKNILAVLQSIATRTVLPTRSADDSREILSGRLQALGRAHELLIEASWAGAPLQHVVEAELAGFTDRVKVAGPEVKLSASAVQTFALIVHELLTNAAKYGALSNAEGEVMVNWSVWRDDDRRFLEFGWEERGGPEVVSTGHQGFGFALISTMGRSLTTSPSIQLNPAGLQCKINIPLDNLLPNNNELHAATTSSHLSDDKNPTGEVIYRARAN
jgi:two-component sensor histidine kinase/AmiR/NasT family two-component response regulator